MTDEPRKAKKTPGGFDGPPAEGGLSIDRLAQAFAAMMGEQDPYETATKGTQKNSPRNTSEFLHPIGGCVRLFQE